RSRPLAHIAGTLVDRYHRPTTTHPIGPKQGPLHGLRDSVTHFRPYLSIGAKKFARSPALLAAGKKRGFCQRRWRSAPTAPEPIFEIGSGDGGILTVDCYLLLTSPFRDVTGC